MDTLRFSRQQNLLAFAAGVVLISVGSYLVWISTFGFAEFAARYEAGRAGHRLVTELNYWSNGWIGAVFFGSCTAFFVIPWLRAITRLFTSDPAVSICGSVLVVNLSFFPNDSHLPLSRIGKVSLCRESDASLMSSGIAQLMAPFGPRSIVSQNGRKICLMIEYSGRDGSDRTLNLSAQFLEGGKWSLGRFARTLKSEIAKSRDTEYSSAKVWIPPRLRSE